MYQYVLQFFFVSYAFNNYKIKKKIIKTRLLLNKIFMFNAVHLKAVEIILMHCDRFQNLFVCILIIISCFKQRKTYLYEGNEILNSNLFQPEHDIHST